MIVGRSVCAGAMYQCTLGQCWGRQTIVFCFYFGYVRILIDVGIV